MRPPLHDELCRCAMVVTRRQRNQAPGRSRHRRGTHARPHLTGPAGLEATVRDLTARETECCSFFSCTTTAYGPHVTLDIEVPDRCADILAHCRQSRQLHLPLPFPTTGTAG